MSSSISEAVERFIKENPEVDERTQQQLRNAPADIQAQAIERGALTGCRDPSAALRSRIRNAQTGGTTASGYTAADLQGDPAQVWERIRAMHQAKERSQSMVGVSAPTMGIPPVMAPGMAPGLGMNPLLQQQLALQQLQQQQAQLALLTGGLGTGLGPGLGLGLPTPTMGIGIGGMATGLPTAPLGLAAGVAPAAPAAPAVPAPAPAGPEASGPCEVPASGSESQAGASDAADPKAELAAKWAQLQSMMNPQAPTQGVPGAPPAPPGGLPGAPPFPAAVPPPAPPVSPPAPPASSLAPGATATGSFAKSAPRFAPY